MWNRRKKDGTKTPQSVAPHCLGVGLDPDHVVKLHRHNIEISTGYVEISYIFLINYHNPDFWEKIKM